MENLYGHWIPWIMSAPHQEGFRLQSFIYRNFPKVTVMTGQNDALTYVQKKKTFAWIASEKETMQILNWIFKKKKEGKREGERERALEKLPGADPLIPLQASRNKLVQTDCIRPSPPYLLYTLLFIYRLSKGDLMTVVNSTMHHGNFSIWTNCTYW